MISRLRNCIVSLVTQRVMLYDTSILYCYEASLPHQVPHAGLPFSALISEQALSVICSVLPQIAGTQIPLP